MTFDQMEDALRERLAAFPPAARAELLHVLTLPDFDRAQRIGDFWGHTETRFFGELLIDVVGHSKSAMTLEIYAGVLDKMKQATAASLDEKIAAASIQPATVIAFPG